MVLQDSIQGRMHKNGIETLSDVELLSIIVHTSKYDKSSEMARLLLTVVNADLNALAKLDINSLMSIKGMGPVKSSRLLACFELNKRRSLQTAVRRSQIRNSKDLYDLLKPRMADLNHEECWAIYMTSQHRIIDCVQMTKGGTDQTTVDIKLILKMALGNFATSIVIAHNHPSGSLQPSSSDDNLTKKAKIACASMDMQLTDHIIITQESYYSYADDGKI